MRVFSLAFIGFVLSAMLLLSHFVPSFALSAGQQAGVALIFLLLAFVLQIESVFLMKKALTRRKETQELRAKVAEAEQKIAQAADAALRKSKGETEVVQFLALLQEKGRLIDFLMEEVAAFTDQQVGAAARVVHKGCAEVLRENFAISALASGGEGSLIELDEGFSSHRYRLLGKVDKAPYRGTIVHPGWRTAKVGLPTLVDAKYDACDGYHLISPVEVELH